MKQENIRLGRSWFWFLLIAILGILLLIVLLDPLGDEPNTELTNTADEMMPVELPGPPGEEATETTEESRENSPSN